jgi:hypothetical protein
LIAFCGQQRRLRANLWTTIWLLFDCGYFLKRFDYRLLTIVDLIGVCWDLVWIKCESCIGFLHVEFCCANFLFKFLLCMNFGHNFIYEKVQGAAKKDSRFQQKIHLIPQGKNSGNVGDQ